MLAYLGRQQEVPSVRRITPPSSCFCMHPGLCVYTISGPLASTVRLRVFFSASVTRLDSIKYAAGHCSLSVSVGQTSLHCIAVHSSSFNRIYVSAFYSVVIVCN